MKTFAILFFTTLLAIHASAQDRLKHDERREGLEQIDNSRNDYREYQSLNRFNYWNSRFDRYWSKYEKFVSGDFSARISRATRNLSAICNNRNADRYTTTNSDRKKGLIKIN